jgi:hypothetical protein
MAIFMERVSVGRWKARESGGARTMHGSPLFARRIFAAWHAAIYAGRGDV